jgi:hypothetical protein
MTNKVRLVASPEVLLRASAAGERQPIYGVYRSKEGLIQLLSQHANPTPLFHRIGCVNPRERVLGTRVALEVDGTLVVVELDKDLPAPDVVQLLDGRQSIDDRRRGLLPEGGLSRKEVHLVGSGSVGSKVGLELGQAGVGLLRFYDRDWLDTPNLTRHVCGLADSGREKAHATAEHVSLFGCNALGATVDFEKIDDRQIDLFLKYADVVVCTTDSPLVQFVVNEAVVRLRKVGVFAGAYELARAGEVLVVRPGIGPCLYCATGFRASTAPSANLHERRQAYQSADLNRLTAEPGLGIDISFLASVTAAHVLAVLDPEGSRAVLLEHGGFTLVHGPSKPSGDHAGLFRRPLDVVHASVVRDEPCPVCGFHKQAEVAS